MPRLTPRIPRVNHAGEHSAVAIYSAQFAHTHALFPSPAWAGEGVGEADG